MIKTEDETRRQRDVADISDDVGEYCYSIKCSVFIEGRKAQVAIEKVSSQKDK